MLFNRNTVPVYSSILANNPAIDKAVIVNVQPRNGFVCTDPTICYPVGSDIVTQNIIFQSDRMPDLQPRVFAGSLIPEVVKVQGIFDIPENQLECDPNTVANEGTACYYRMPPGTTQTWTFITMVSTLWRLI